MITKSFIEGVEYQELKATLIEAFQNKPINLKTEGKTNEMIARETTAYEISAKALAKAIRAFEAKVMKPKLEEQKYI